MLPYHYSDSRYKIRRPRSPECDVIDWFEISFKKAPMSFYGEIDITGLISPQAWTCDTWEYHVIKQCQVNTLWHHHRSRILFLWVSWQFSSIIKDILIILFTPLGRCHFLQIISHQIPQLKGWVAYMHNVVTNSIQRFSFTRCIWTSVSLYFTYARYKFQRYMHWIQDR